MKSNMIVLGLFTVAIIVAIPPACAWSPYPVTHSIRRTTFSSVLTTTSALTSTSRDSDDENNDPTSSSWTSPQVVVQNLESPQPTTSMESEQRKVSILLCPAQFCVPADYDVLWDELRKLQSSSSSDSTLSSSNVTLGTTIVTPLSRTDWIKVAKALPTSDFFNGQLPVHSTLDWYFQAIEEGLNEIIARDGPTTNICIIGHSIGGWVARAYLGGCSRSSTATFQRAREQCTSLITLGTPHLVSPRALVDQTRGLISEIERTPSCSPQSLQQEYNIDITCVCSAGVKGEFWKKEDGFNSGTKNENSLANSFIAAASYLPLVGTIIDTKGDGIVPLSLAFLKDTRHVTLERCSITQKVILHSHVLPTPWNLWDGTSPSISLLSSSSSSSNNDDDKFVSYISPGVVSQWAQYIR